MMNVGYKTSAERTQRTSEQRTNKTINYCFTFNSVFSHSNTLLKLVKSLFILIRVDGRHVNIIHGPPQSS